VVGGLINTKPVAGHRHPHPAGGGARPFQLSANYTDQMAPWCLTPGPTCSPPPARTGVHVVAATDLTRNAGATGQLHLGHDQRRAGLHQHGPTLVNGILGGWASFGSNWPRLHHRRRGAGGRNEHLCHHNLPAGVATENHDITRGSAFPAGVTVNSLRLSGTKLLWSTWAATG